MGAINKAMETFWIREGSVEGHKEVFFCENSADLPFNVLSKAVNALPTDLLERHQKREAVIEAAIFMEFSYDPENQNPDTYGAITRFSDAVQALKEMESKL